MRKSIYKNYIKRPMDFILALFGIVVFSPLILFIACLVKIKCGSPVFFIQTRIGRYEKPFKIIKFRTMSNSRDINGKLLPDAERITKFGMFLRSSSIDELPGLLNVLIGQMSLIGPRPLPMCCLPYFKENERTRHSIRGGLSGYAQVNGRNSLSWDIRFAYDVEYTENITFLFDLRIFLKTIEKVFKHSDIGLRGVSAPEDLSVCRKSLNSEIKTPIHM